MSKQSVFLVGATGETGAAILDALVADGSFHITCFIRTSSAYKPSTQNLRDRGLTITTGDITGPVEETVRLLHGINTVIVAIWPFEVATTIPLIDAAVLAGVTRFVPCNFGTPAARGGIMKIHDLKEEVHDHIFRTRLSYTIIDVGYWYQSSYPRVPSGRFDEAAFTPINEVYAGGTAANMLMDKRDVGRFTVECIKDGRTLNKRVYGYGDFLCQNEINAIVEGKSGERLELTQKSAEEMFASLEATRAASEADPTNIPKVYEMVWAEYCNTKYVRADNTPDNAEYLGYINGRELYPNFEWIRFAAFVDELIAGTVTRPYPHLQLQEIASAR